MEMLVKIRRVWPDHHNNLIIEDVKAMTIVDNVDELLEILRYVLLLHKE